MAVILDVAPSRNRVGVPAQIGFAVLVACFGGTVPAAMVELVPDRVRCTVLSVGYNAGMAVLGGMTPMGAVYTIQRSQYDLSPAFLLMAAAAGFPPLHCPPAH